MAQEHTPRPRPQASPARRLLVAIFALMLAAAGIVRSLSSGRLTVRANNSYMLAKMASPAGIATRSPSSE